MQKELFEILVAKYLDGKATEQEKQVLFAQMDHITDRASGNTDLDKEALYEKIRLQLDNGLSHPASSARVHLMHRLRWVAAAVIILVAGALTWKYMLQPTAQKAELVISEIKAPASNRATITLDNGQTVYLDSADNGRLAALGNVELVKLADGQIAYSGTEGAVSYHTLANPKGSRVIYMQLTDGSHVWLNAGSSIRYPVPMTGKTRDVTISGEAYFEVAKLANRPFIVASGETKVTVLGTHFNVKAYANEPDLKVTLVEGSVSVQQQPYTQLLKPGQQAVLTDDKPIKLIPQADLTEALAWKNGIASFHAASLQVVLNEIERWYDITVVFAADKSAYANDSFYAEVKRSAPLRDLLQVLKDSQIRYVFDEGKRTLTILPK